MKGGWIETKPNLTEKQKQCAIKILKRINDDLLFSKKTPSFRWG